MTDPHPAAGPAGAPTPGERAPLTDDDLRQLDRDLAGFTDLWSARMRAAARELLARRDAERTTAPAPAVAAAVDALVAAVQTHSYTSRAYPNSGPFFRAAERLTAARAALDRALAEREREADDADPDGPCASCGALPGTKHTAGCFYMLVQVGTVGDMAAARRLYDALRARLAAAEAEREKARALADALTVQREAVRAERDAARADATLAEEGRARWKAEWHALDRRTAAARQLATVAALDRDASAARADALAAGLEAIRQCIAQHVARGERHSYRRESMFGPAVMGTITTVRGDLCDVRADVDRIVDAALAGAAGGGATGHDAATERSTPDGQHYVDCPNTGEAPDRCLCWLNLGTGDPERVAALRGAGR